MDEGQDSAGQAALLDLVRLVVSGDWEAEAATATLRCCITDEATLEQMRTLVVRTPVDATWTDVVRERALYTIDTALGATGRFGARSAT